MKLLLQIILTGLFVLILKDSAAEPSIDHLITIDQNFELENVNSKLFKKADWSLHQLPSSGLQSYFLELFKRNETNGFTFLCKSYESQSGWVFFEIINRSKYSKKLTLYTEKIKCDGLKMYFLLGDSLSKKAEIRREMPLKERFYANYDFAFPISIEANQQLGILLESVRRIGINELNIKIVEESRYKSEVFPRLTWTLFLMTLGFVTACLLLILGLMYKNGLMISLGAYLMSISLGFATLFSFHDTLDFPDFLALDASSMMQFAPLLCNLFVYPFLYQLRLIYKPSRFFFTVFIVFAFVNIILLLLLLFSTSHNELLTKSYHYFLLLNIILLIFEIVSFTVHTKRYFFFLAALVGLGANLIESVYRYIVSVEYPVVSMINYSLAPIGIILLAWGGVNEIRYGLISMENHEKSIKKEREELEDQRKEEIERIGRDLHDNIGNSLASILGFLSLKKPNLPLINEQITKLIKEIRLISHSIVKDDNLILTERIQKLIERLNDSTEIDFSFTTSILKFNEYLLPFQQQNLYFIIQEVLINSIKHASPSEVSIQLFEDEDDITITIEDDGAGMDIKNQEDGIGLGNIYKRAEISNFKLFLDSSKRGTCVIIQIQK